MAQEIAEVGSTQFVGSARNPVSRLLRAARRKPLGTVSALILMAVWALALLSPVITPYEWDDLFTGDKLAGPTLEGSHFFGTDNSGRDVFTRVLVGGRTTLTTSLIATIGGMALAGLFGVLSGYFLGLYDLIFQRVSDSLQALPGLVVLMVAAAAFNQSRTAVLIILMVLTAPAAGRVLRAQTLVLRNLAYIEAARSIGGSNSRIVLRHIVPNVLPLVIVIFTISIGGNMLILTTLSFLGVINPATPDWGGMLNVASQQYIVSAPWLAIFPGAAITLSVLSYNLLGDALRDVLDPRLRGS